MLEYLTIGEGTIAYDIAGTGHLVVLAHGMGDTRHSYRFLVPELVAAGYRVASVDIRGCGDSSTTGWAGYERTDIAGDLVAVVRHLGGPAVIVGQSISGGAATIAAATAPDVIVGIVGLAPFTRKQSFDLIGVLKNKHVRTGMTQLTKVMVSSGWADPRGEGEKILGDLRGGLGELVVIDGAGHYPHTETPKAVLAAVLPVLGKTHTTTAIHA